jgi:hypothetical protein
LPFPELEGFPHFGFGVHAQSVRDPVDVVEIGDYLDQVKDIAVGETMGA